MGCAVGPADHGINSLGRSPLPQRDHRSAAGQGLDRNDAEVVLAGEKQRPAAAIVVADHLVGLPAEKPDGRPRHPLEMVSLRSFTDDDQRAAGERAGGHGVLDSLVGHQGRDAEVEILPRARLPACRSR